MYSGAAVLAALVLLVSFDTGLCIKCYQCTSTNNPSCRDPFNNAKAVSSFDCNTNEVVTFYNHYLNSIMPPPQTINAPRYCLKMTLGGSLGDTVIRTCVEGASNNPNKTCSELERSAVFGQFASSVTKQTLKHCSVCTGESCNGVGNIAASLGLASVAAALAYLAY